MLSVISFSKKVGSGGGKSNQLSWQYFRSTAAGCNRDRGGDGGEGVVYLCFSLLQVLWLPESPGNCFFF
jgi:hypothetical protein